MGIYEYRESLEISKGDPGFYALLFSLIRKADSSNLSRLTAMWPDEVAEMKERYNAPGGVLTKQEGLWLERLNSSQEGE
jgi:hypothetical protein